MKDDDLEKVPPATLAGLMNLEADDSPWDSDELEYPWFSSHLYSL